MRESLAFCLAAIVVLALPTAPSAAETTLPTAGSEPAELVRAALRTELNGPSDARKALLDRALAIDPDFAPARWQSGFVRFDGQWLKVDDVPRHARGIEHLADYRKLRDGMVDTADNHRALARWCHKNKLPDEERVHWAKVLEYEHTDAEALDALGLQRYNGRLLTRSQIDEEKKQAGEARRAMQRWQPQFVKWRKAIEHGTPKQLDEALRGLKDLNDPAAIPALEAVFAVNGEAPKQVELNKLLIETVGRMPVPEATQVLLRRAIVPDSLETRSAACDELKKRPMQTFVPALFAILPLSDEVQVKTQWLVWPLADGTVMHRHEVVLRDSRKSRHIVYESALMPFWDSLLELRALPSRLNAELADAAAIENNVHLIHGATRETRERLKKRIQAILVRATPFGIEEDPGAWLEQWDRYLESYSGSMPPPPRDEFLEYYFRWRCLCSCFPRGTPILTAVGFAPIESLRAGDRVLAQNPATGELAYEVVLGTTLRPANPMVEIGLGSESIRATLGHHFWVCGHGWLMAKQLKRGMSLHGVDGPVVIDDVKQSPAAEAYNLVVSDFGTYFVGQRRLLVHDVMLMKETAETVPGLAAETLAARSVGNE